MRSDSIWADMEGGACAPAGGVEGAGGLAAGDVTGIAVFAGIAVRAVAAACFGVRRVCVCVCVCVCVM